MFAPLIVVVPVAVLLKVTLLNVCAPPVNTGAALLQVIVEVPALNVRFVPAKLIGVVPLQEIAEEPRIKERTPLPVEFMLLSVQA